MRHEIIPNLRYADAPRSLAFLCEAFGFARKAVHLDKNDPRIVQHAQLLWNDREATKAALKPTARRSGFI